MLTHFMLGANELDVSLAFYDAVMGALGIDGQRTPDGGFYRRDGMTMGVKRPRNGAPVQPSNGLTISFAARDTGEVDAFHAEGLAHGGTDEGGPGIRQNAPGNAYGAYLRDPAGNKICAFCQVSEME